MKLFVERKKDFWEKCLFNSKVDLKTQPLTNLSLSFSVSLSLSLFFFFLLSPLHHVHTTANSLVLVFLPTCIICMQVRKQQLELDMEQQTGSK